MCKERHASDAKKDTKQYGEYKEAMDAKMKDMQSVQWGGSRQDAEVRVRAEKLGAVHMCHDVTDARQQRACRDPRCLSVWVLAHALLVYIEGEKGVCVY